MSTDKIDPSNAEQKVSKDELSDKDLAKVAGGGTNNTTKTTTSDAPKETVTFEYGGLQIKYGQQ